MNKITNFFKEVVKEMKYVNWPKKADIVEGTKVVVAMSVLVALYLSLVDLGFGFLSKLAFGSL